MSKVEIDVTAKTGQAEKALADLTRDVDKLQRKANEIGRTTSLSGSTRKSVPATDKQTVSGHRGGATNKIDLSGLNSAFSSLTSQMGAFGSGLEQATSGLSNMIEQLAYMRFVWGGIKNTYSRVKASRQDQLIFNSAAKERSRALIGPINERIARAEHGLAAVQRLSMNPHLSDRTISGMGDRYANLNNELRILKARRLGIQTAIDFGPLGGRVSAQQRAMRGSAQLLGAIGNADALQRLQAAGLKPGAFRAMGNFARAGLQFGAAPLRAMGAGIGAALGPIGGAIGPAAGVAAGIAAGASPLIYAGAQVAEGRQKAEELEGLNSQLSLLAKNLTGTSGDASALAESIQKLGVDGAVPVEQLAQGAQMLMLAFKGNQTETAKWTNILADMSAGTGQSVEYFAEMITKANQFGSVEFEVFNQLNEKGIPIIEQLKGKFGDTREEIMKAAQAGKITAEEFMKAFEAAHKASMEGANAAKQVATLSGLQQQTRELEELEAANYTRGYDREMMEYERGRNERARRRAEDESLAAGGEILGATVGDLVTSFKSLVDVVGDATDALFSWYAKITGATDAQGGLNVAEMSLYNTTSSIMADGYDRFKNEGEEGYYYSAAELSGVLEQLNQNHTRLRRIQNDDDFSDEVRADAKAAADEAERLIEQFQESYNRAVAREAEEKRVQEGQAVLASYNQSKAKTEDEILSSKGFESIDDLYTAINDLESKIERGEGTRADLAQYQELENTLKTILDLREDIAEEERKAAEDRRRTAEEEARKAEQARKEAERLAREEHARDMARMEHQMSLNPDDQELKLEYEYTQQSDKLRNLGFSDDEITSMLTEKRAAQIVSVEKQMRENNANIEKEKQAIEDNKKTGIEGIENAWGSVQRTMTSFTSPYEQDQLKELEGINDKLQEEIDALNRLDTRARAL